MKITSFIELFSEIRRVGIEQNQTFSTVQHPTLVGDMYEGLAREMIEASLFEKLDLKVAKGLITSSSGRHSRQVDCMIVRGDGTKLPHTDHSIFHINDVLAVIEVKKTLSRDEIRDCFDKTNHLTTLVVEELSANGSPSSAAMHRDGFSAVSGLVYPDGPIDGEPVSTIYRWLMAESIVPLTIALGFYGYLTEVKFREALVDELRQRREATRDSLGIPTCVVAGDLVFVKSNGMPFVHRKTELQWTRAYTQKGLVSRTLVNLIWYRICRLLNRDYAALTDGKAYSCNPLSILRTTKKGGLVVEYPQIKTKELLTQELPRAAPTVISVEEHLLIQKARVNVLTVEDPANFVTTLSESARAFVASHSLGATAPAVLNCASFDELIEHVTRSGFLNWDGKQFRTTTSRLLTVMTQGGLVAGENRDGKFNWLLPTGLQEYLSDNGTLSDHLSMKVVEPTI
jgi:hypothetical protein